MTGRSAVCLALAALTSVTSFGGGIPKALMVFFDGGRADCFANADCPNLHRLADGTWAKGYRGAWSLSARVNDDMPTYSYGNHASILTGVTAAKHGVLYNCQYDKGAYKKWPSWLTRLLDARPAVKAVAEFEDGSDAKIAPDTRVPMHTGGGGADRLVAAYSKSAAPDVALFFLHQPDSAGHSHGYYPSAKEYLEGFSESDRELGKVLDSIVRRPSFAEEDWLIAFVSDHGGRARMHGVQDAHCRTVPLIVSSRSVVSGELFGQPRHYDLPILLLDHFGVKAGGFGLDGRIIGDRAFLPAAGSPDECLVCHVLFDGPLRYGTDTAPNRIAGKIETRPYGDLQYFTCGLTDRGSPTRESMWIDGIDEPTALRVDGAESVFSDRRRGFTVSFWMRKYMPPEQEGQTVICGNRDILGNGAGFDIRYQVKTPRFSPGIALEWRGKDGRHHVPAAFLQEGGQWNFYAVIVRSDGVVQFCQGRHDGKFHWVADSSEGADFDSGLPFYLGQDGTGKYPKGGHGGFDEFKIWNRALTLDEVRREFVTTMGSGK